MFAKLRFILTGGEFTPRAPLTFNCHGALFSVLKTGLLWNTYRGDYEWFTHSARSYSKFARGWDFAKCVVPKPDLKLFQSVCEQSGIHLVGFDEWPGKGFNHHQAMQCMGDLHFPEAEVIFHVDADCVFASNCTPSDWLPGGKILLPFTDFHRFLDRPVEPDEMLSFMGFTGRRVDFNRSQYLWKFAADFALGWSVERETMGWMPLAHHRDVYSRTREIIARRFSNLGFEGYVMNCRNEWPQSFCEFNTLGGVAHKFFQEKYQWQDITLQGYPFAGKVAQCWSHGGFDRPYDFAGEVGGHQTPRQLFERLGV